MIASSSSRTELKLRPSALLAPISFRIWGSFTITDPRMIPMPRPLLSTIFRHGTTDRKQQSINWYYKRDMTLISIVIEKLRWIGTVALTNEELDTTNHVMPCG